ncbi:MAG: hypothetical protein ACRDGK_06095 [Actinomycetota bacterium]
MIGRITFGGSIGLVWIGALGGMPLAAVYLVARRWLPRQRVARGLWFGLLAMGLFGAFLLGDTSDFRFAEAGPQLAMYGVMFLLFGFVGSLLAERLGQGLPEPRPSTTGYVVLGVMTLAGLASIADPSHVSLGRPTLFIATVAIRCRQLVTTHGRSCLPACQWSP